MNRQEFIYFLLITPIIWIFGCEITSTNQNGEFMGEVKGKSAGTGTVHFKVLDKDGNVKYTGKSTAQLKPTKKVKRGTDNG